MDISLIYWLAGGIGFCLLVVQYYMTVELYEDLEDTERFIMVVPFLAYFFAFFQIAGYALSFLKERYLWKRNK